MVTTIVGLFLQGCGAASVTKAPRDNDLINQPAPNFTAETIDGDTFELNEKIGNRLIVMNVWGTWCPPCRAELPALNRFYHENREDVLFIGIALNIEESNVRRFMRKFDLEFPVILSSRDLDDGMTNLYEVPTVPTTIVVDRDGKVIYYKPGMLRKRHFRFLRDLVTKTNHQE